MAFKVDVEIFVATSLVTLDDEILAFVTSAFVAVKLVNVKLGVLTRVVISNVPNVIAVAKIELIVILFAKKLPAVNEFVNQPIPDVIPVENTPVAEFKDVVEIFVNKAFVVV